jgi:hypothetical protein
MARRATKGDEHPQRLRGRYRLLTRGSDRSRDHEGAVALTPSAARVFNGRATKGDEHLQRLRRRYRLLTREALIGVGAVRER